MVERDSRSRRSEVRSGVTKELKRAPITREQVFGPGADPDPGEMNTVQEEPGSQPGNRTGLPEEAGLHPLREPASHTGNTRETTG